MGPRPIGRGNPKTISFRVLFEPASMGPRPIGRGNFIHAVPYGLVWNASMGPRPIGRGNNRSSRQPGWSHHASMGPRPIGRGNHDDCRDAGVLRRASMGPRPIGRGNANVQAVASARCGGFNGAATNRSRKLCHSNPFNVKEQHNHLRAATQVSHSTEHHSFRTVGKLLQMRAFQSASGAAWD